MILAGDTDHLLRLDQLDAPTQEQAAVFCAMVVGAIACQGDLTLLSPRHLTLARIYARVHQRELSDQLDQLMSQHRIHPTLRETISA